MAELREEMRAKTEYIRSKGYNVVEMYECEWRQTKHNNRELQQFIATEVRRTLDRVKTMSVERILSEVRNECLFGFIQNSVIAHFWRHQVQSPSLEGDSPAPQLPSCVCT